MHSYALIKNIAFNFGHHTIEKILISWREYKEGSLK